MFKIRVEHCFSLLEFIHRQLMAKTTSKLNFSMSFFKNDKSSLMEIPCVMILCHVSFLVMFIIRATIDVHNFAFEINSFALFCMIVMTILFLMILMIVVTTTGI